MEGRGDCFLKKQRFRTGEKPKDRKSMALPYHRQKKHPLPESLQEQASLKMDSTHHNKSRKATKEPRKSVSGVGVLLFELGTEGVLFLDSVFVGFGRSASFLVRFVFSTFAAEAGRRVALMTILPSKVGTTSSSFVTSYQTKTHRVTIHELHVFLNALLKRK